MKIQKIRVLATAVGVILFSLAGCKKDASQKAVNAAATNGGQNGSTSDPLVLTPGGWLPKSHVHFVEPGYHLDVRTGHVLKIEDASGKIAADFGERHLSMGGPQTQPQKSFGKSFTATPTNPGTDGWVGFSNWNSAYPITYFSSRWTVPGTPGNTQYGQTIFLFNATSQADQSDILQPVLQWGPSSAGGGNYWSIGNWYGWDSNAYFAYSGLVNVSSGTAVTGVINNTGLNGTSYNFSVGFTGYSNTLNVIKGNANLGVLANGSHTIVVFPTIPAETWAYETMESYNSVNFNGGNGVVFAPCYPPQLDVPMANITLTTSNGPAALFWNTYIGDFSTVGEHATLVSNNSTGAGEVDLYFRGPIITYPSPDAFNVGTHYSISPTNTGSPATSYIITPLLPTGLSMSSTTGVISGTPTYVSPQANYTVTASGGGVSGTFIVAISTVIPGINFAITNNSGNGLAITFVRTDISQTNISMVAPAHSGSNPPLSVPPGTYTIKWNPSGMPVNCVVNTNTGLYSSNSPGGQFVGVVVGSGGATSLSAN